MKRQPLPWPPQLITQERPAPGAATLLDSAFSSLRWALEGADLASAGVVIATHDSSLAPLSAAWGRRPHAEVTTRARVLQLAHEAKLPTPALTPSQVPVLLGVKRRMQLVALDFAPRKGATR